MSEANAANSRRVLEEAFNEGRLEVFDEVCSPGVVSHDPAEQGDVTGIEAHKQRVAMYRTAMSDLHVSVDDVIDGGDKVVLRWTASGTNDGELMGMPPTGRKVSITGLSEDRFENGQIVEVWDQWDNAGFMSQLGLTPEMAAQAS